MLHFKGGVHIGPRNTWQCVRDVATLGHIVQHSYVTLEDVDVMQY